MTLTEQQQQAARKVDSIQQEMKCLDLYHDIKQKLYIKKNGESFYRKYGFYYTEEIGKQIMNYKFNYINPENDKDKNIELLTKLKNTSIREYDMCKDF